MSSIGCYWTFPVGAEQPGVLEAEGGGGDGAGRNCLMTKADWSDAYKHIRVRKEDRILQWFSWMGWFFVELALVFGTVSSPGIYDRAA